MSAEAQIGARWLVDTLASDTTLSDLAPGGVWDTRVPEDVAHPVVVVAWQGDSDVVVVGAARVASNQVWVCKVIGDEPSFDALHDAAARLDELLHDTSGTTTGGEVFASVRERSVRLEEHDGNRQWRHLGGIYRTWTQAS